MQVAGVFEVSHVSPIRPLADFQSADGLRNEPVEISVALPVGMGGQIDRHVVPKRGEVGAVIEIPAAQVILIRFAGVGMLDHHQAGRRLENLTGVRERTSVEIRAGNRHLARHAGRHCQTGGDVQSAGLVGRRRRGHGGLSCSVRCWGMWFRRWLTFGGNRDGRKARAARLCGRCCWADRSWRSARRYRPRFRRRRRGNLARRCRLRRWRRLCPSAYANGPNQNRRRCEQPGTQRHDTLVLRGRTLPTPLPTAVFGPQHFRRCSSTPPRRSYPNLSGDCRHSAAVGIPLSRQHSSLGYKTLASGIPPKSASPRPRSA